MSGTLISYILDPFLEPEVRIGSMQFRFREPNGVGLDVKFGEIFEIRDPEYPYFGNSSISLTKWILISPSPSVEIWILAYQTGAEQESAVVFELSLLKTPLFRYSVRFLWASQSCSLKVKY